MSQEKIQDVRKKLQEIAEELDTISRNLLYIDAEDAEDDLPTISSDIDDLVTMLTDISNKDLVEIESGTK